MGGTVTSFQEREKVAGAGEKGQDVFEAGKGEER